MRSDIKNKQVFGHTELLLTVSNALKFNFFSPNFQLWKWNICRHKFRECAVFISWYLTTLLIATRNDWNVERSHLFSCWNMGQRKHSGPAYKHSSQQSGGSSSRPSITMLNSSEKDQYTNYYRRLTEIRVCHDATRRPLATRACSSLHAANRQEDGCVIAS